jgi:hypothetical protein
MVVLLCVLVTSCQNLVVHIPSENSTNGGIEEARMKFWNAYNATVEAERTGADVSEAAERLNDALDYFLQAQNLALQGDVEQALLLTQASMQLSEETLILAQELKQRAEIAAYTRSIISIGISIALVILCVSALLLGRRIWKRRQQKKFLDMQVKEAPAQNEFR